MWQDKAGADKDSAPGTGATVGGEGVANALTPGAVSAVPTLSTPGGGNGPASPAGPGEQRWSFVTGGRTLSMLQPTPVQS